MSPQRSPLRTFWKQAKVLVFNLPDDEVPSRKERRRAAKTTATEPAQSTPVSGSKWAAAVQRADAPTREQETTPEPPTGSSTIHGWRPVQNSKRPLYKTVLRWAVGLLLFLFLLIGLRTAIWGPANVPKAPELPKEAKFPQQEAAGTAEEFTTAYLNWDESSPQTRRKDMSLFYSGQPSQSTGQLGWDGKGKQDADNAHAVRFHVLDDQHARVTVLADVTTYKTGKKGSSPEAADHRKVALEVNVKATNDGATITGVPGVVGVPAGIPGDDQAKPVTEDTGLAESTKADATKFFQAYGSGKDLESITAPGSHITGTDGYLSDPELKTWTVVQGSGDTRTGTAVVEWGVEGGSTSEQTYTVTLQKVSSGSTDRWMISNLEGTQNND